MNTENKHKNDQNNIITTYLTWLFLRAVSKIGPRLAVRVVAHDGHRLFEYRRRLTYRQHHVHVSAHSWAQHAIIRTPLYSTHNIHMSTYVHIRKLFVVFTTQ